MRLPEIEVVGVFVYSEAKTRGDIGDIVGLPPYGLKATMDREAIFALRPDVILYTPMDHGDFRQDDEIMDILRRGINVVTSMPYQNVSVRGAEIEAKIQQAALDGGATLFATGVNPGFIVERIALAATGGTNAITEICAEEFVRIGTEPQETLNAFGFGLPADVSGRKSAAATIAEQYERQFIYYLGEAFGTPVKELRYSADWKVASEATQAPTMVIEKDTVAYVSHRWEGITDGPKIVFIVYWYMTDEFKPADVPCEDYYRITIEGRPSMRLGIELRASIADDMRTYPGDPAIPAFYVTAVNLVQAIPKVIAAAPGIKRIEYAANSYFKADMRK
ncbi:MAG: hypothetical protein P8Y48_16995 [Novosphingobium sp.]